MSVDRYPAEVLDEDADDGTMPSSVDELRAAVVGHRIVSVEKRSSPSPRYNHDGEPDFMLTLDNGRQVCLFDTDDCCAYTELREFLLHPELVDHVIVGVGTTGEFERWHIFADAGDVLELTVGWSAGNPFYYSYGFGITVRDVPAAQRSEQAD